MPTDAIDALFDRVEAHERDESLRQQREEEYHRRLLLTMPEFLKELFKEVQDRFDAFNRRAGKRDSFSISTGKGNVLTATKRSCPKATFRIETIPEIDYLFIHGNAGREEFDGRYTMKLRGFSIHLEERFSRDHKHVAIEEIEDQVLLPFFAAIVNGNS